MDVQASTFLKVIVLTIITVAMSSIIPIDLTAFATNPLYLNQFLPANVSATSASTIKLLSYNSDFVNVIGQNATARQLYNLDWQAFHEAGVWNKATQKLYVTSNWAGDLKNPINVTILDINDYSYTETRYSNLAEPNGATSYSPPGTNLSNPSQVLYCDEGDFTSPSGLVAVDPSTNKSTPILTNYLGRNFSSINDARQHPITGDIWFTDADYGYYQFFRPAPTIPKQVYRFTPSTGEISVVATDFVQSNGLEFSSDLKTLYVSDTGAAGGNLLGTNLTRPATIYAFDISSDHKRLSNRRTFAYADNGFPDGVHCDCEGNVWAGCGDGIHIWNPEGTLLGKIWNGVETNNFAFVPGKVLIFSNRQLWVVEGLKAVGREVGKDFGV